MRDTQEPAREDLKSNVLPFTLSYAAPDHRPPSAARGLVTLAVLLLAAGLILLTVWSLIDG